MPKNRSGIFIISFLTIIVIFMLASCGSEQMRSPKPRSEWSRGIRVGFAHGLTQPSMIVEADGTASIAWTVETALSSGEIGLSKLAPNGDFLIQSTFSIPESHLRGTSLRQGSQGMEICWISDEGVRCSLINETDPAHANPYTLISAPPDIHLFTSAGEHYAWVTVDGGLFISIAESEPIQISTQATNVDLTFQDGELLVSWTEAKSDSETTLWLATVSGDSVAKAQQVSRITAGVLAGLRQVGLGAVSIGDQYCLVYGYEFTRGLEGGSASTRLTCIDRQTLTLESEQRLELVMTEKPDYATYDGPFALARLAHIEIPYSNFTYLPSDPIALYNQMAIVVSTPSQVRYNVHQDIAMLILEDGVVLGYQPVATTSSSSLSPNLTGDAEGNLYVAWLERSIGNDIYFATTNPQASDVLNQYDSSEVTVIVLGIIIEAVTGLFLLPFMLLAVGLAYIAVFVTSWVANLIGLGRWKDLIGFIFGMVALWLAKLLLLPSMFFYVPFSSWLPEIPTTMVTAYTYFWPLFIVSASLFFSNLIIKRRDISSLATRFGLYAILDITLTALIYGVMLQGAT